MNIPENTPARRFSFDAASVWLLALTAFAAMLAFVPVLPVSFIGTKISIIAIGVLLALMAFVIARLTRGNIVVPPLALLGTVWLLPLAYALSGLFSGANLAQAFLGIQFEPQTFGFMLLLALLTTLAGLALRRTEDYKTFFLVGAAGAALAFLAQVGIIIASRFMPTLAPTGNLIGAFSDVGMLAGLSVVLSLLAFRFFALSSRFRIALWVGIVVALALLALVNSTLVWVLVALSSLGLFIESMLRRRSRGEDADLAGVTTLSADEDMPEAPASARLMAGPIITLLVSLFFLIGGGTIGSSFASSLGISTIDVRPSWQSTFLVGSHTYASSPLFGSGPGTFGEQWLKYRDRSLNDTLFWNIDFGSGIGFIPTSLVTTGIVGVLAWVIFIGFFLYTMVRTLLFRLPKEGFLRFVSVASAAGASYVLLLALFGTPGPVILALGFLLLGAFISTTRHGRERGEWGIAFSKNPRAGFIIVFLLTLLLLGAVAGAYVVLERYLGDAAYGKAATELAAGNVDAAEAALERSVSFAPTERAYRLAASSGVSRMQGIAGDTSLSATTAQQQFQAALTASINAALMATQLGPQDYQNWITLGGVYQSVASLKIEGAYESAKAAFEKAAELNPSSPVIPYVLAQLEIGEGNTKAAEERLLSSVSLKRDYIPAILLLSQLEIQLGKAPEALQASEAAAYFAPNDPAVLFQVGLLRSGTGDTDGAIAALSRAVELNPQYANARFFLAAMYANKGQNEDALRELRAVAALSAENAAAVAPDIASLEAAKNPFPLTRLRSLGIPQPPVAEPTPDAQ